MENNDNNNDVSYNFIRSTDRSQARQHHLGFQLRPNLSLSYSDVAYNPSNISSVGYLPYTHT